MVTLERIDSQKNQIMASCYVKKTVTLESGEQIKPKSLVLTNVTFGLKSRFMALIGLLEG